jgi:hypothetical protein
MKAMYNACGISGASAVHYKAVTTSLDNLAWSHRLRLAVDGLA